MSKLGSRPPLITALALLTLPLVYVGSYLALVDPNRDALLALITPSPDPPLPIHDYRVGGQVATMAFWPLEQMDRKLRPKVWARRTIHTIEYVEGLDLMILHGPNEPTFAGSPVTTPAVAEQMKLFNALQGNRKQRLPSKK